MVTAPIRGRAFGDIFWLVQDGGVAKIRAKRMFCLGHVLSQAQHACTDLGAACAGVTCERPASGIAGEEPGGCSVRMGIEGLRRSPFGEVTYLKSLAHANLFLRYRQEAKEAKLAE
ncbi:hypothetical protein AK812_SmicGene18270 [Symbiodinium microadriaticum]|uniref:Uncharacterized protein n=1 Tax=Symbiodinium microadriaticum TaxID=2951 RepID=A0A1Q9DVK2_SYMMI|nr:hypothetical protein AK812_SmicGene18270 [Symbiodinium microadriaticum]